MIRFDWDRIIIKNSILSRILVLVTIMSLLIIAYSITGLYQGWADLRQAAESNLLQEITHPFAKALKNFMFERGRVNVVLAAPDPISDDNRIFISERRAIADEFFLPGFDFLAERFPDQAQRLKQEYEFINSLRAIVDDEMEKPLAARNHDMRTLWFDSCTGFIDLASETLKETSASYGSYLTTRHNVIIIDTIQFRSIVGIESSILTAALSGGQKISSDNYSNLLYLRGKSDQLWTEISNNILVLDSKKLDDAAKLVQDLFYRQFRAEQDEYLQLALTGQIHETAGAEIAALSVPALDSILGLTDAAVADIQEVNQASLRRGYFSFGSALLRLILAIFILIFIPQYLKRRLVIPLNKIIVSLDDLSGGKTDIKLPDLRQDDEIGKLAKGVRLLKKSIDEEQLLKKRLRKAVAELREISGKDPLTGLYNRRFAMARLIELENRHKRAKTVFSLVICDIDDFKKVNDNYGHEYGDKVLLGVTKNIRAQCRDQDIPSRWGGEEFLIILPGTDAAGAAVFAGRIQKALANHQFKIAGGELKVTLTFGVSEFDPAHGINQVIRNADLAMLKGKKQGKNRIISI